MFRNLVTSFLRFERVETTDAKAKAVRSIAEKMVTLGKRGDLHARRRALAFVRDPQVVDKLFRELSPRFQGRPGGYTRIVKIGNRRGDNAPVSLVEFLDRPVKEKAPKKAPEEK